MEGQEGVGSVPVTADAGDDQVSFGHLLRRLRRAAGLTQQALAERAGLSLDAVGMLERGVRRAPRMATVTLLAQGLGLSGVQRDALAAAADLRLGEEEDGQQQWLGPPPVAPEPAD